MLLGCRVQRIEGRTHLILNLGLVGVVVVLMVMVVIDEEEDSHVTEEGELHGFLEKALLALAVGYL